jgi:hypothetical protein
MITTSPERRRMGTGSMSRVRPPMRKTAAFPSLGVELDWPLKDKEEKVTI